jgi:hypothetical protein
MKIIVTSEHIAKGRENFKQNKGFNACNCPIALALRDAGFKDVIISPTGRFHYQTDGPRTTQLPSFCANFISYFDMSFSSEDALFWPFDFEITVAPN